MALCRVLSTRPRDEALACGSVAYHVAGVARLRPGERIEVSDPVRAYRAVIQSCTPAAVPFQIEGPVLERTRLPLVEAGLVIIRFNRFEWTLEILTELGVARIIPVVTGRSNTRLVARASERLVRWRRIAFEAAQARGTDCPAANAITQFADLLWGPVGKMRLEKTCFEQFHRPSQSKGKRAPALRFGNHLPQTLLAALVAFRLLPRGFDNRQVGALVAPSLGYKPAAWKPGRTNYDLRGLRLRRPRALCPSKTSSHESTVRSINSGKVPRPPCKLDSTVRAGARLGA